MQGKHSLRKKSFRVLEQKSFQCELPDRIAREGSSPSSVQSGLPRNFQSKTSQTGRLPSSPDSQKRIYGLRPTPSQMTKTSALLHLKSQPDLKKRPQGAKHIDMGCSPEPRDEPEDSLRTLTHRLTKITAMQQAERTALNQVITDLSKKAQYARQPVATKSKIVEQNRLQLQQLRLERELSVLKRSNAELRNENSTLKDELNRLRRQKHVSDQVHKAEVARLNLQISRLKILLFQTVDELNKEERPQRPQPQPMQEQQLSNERINHVYTYEKYDKPRSSHLQRISEIDPKLEMSSINIRHQDHTVRQAKQQECNGLYSSQHIRLEQSTINTGTENRNPSFLSNEIDFLEIDSKESSGVNRT